MSFERSRSDAFGYFRMGRHFRFLASYIGSATALPDTALPDYVTRHAVKLMRRHTFICMSIVP